MARFCTLFSGSDGNCTYISGSDSALLVDAGYNCKQILLALESRAIDPGTISGIVLTHEHSDHISGLRVLLKKLKVPVYATPGVLERLRWMHALNPDQRAFEVKENEGFAIGSIAVDCFDTPHDSIHSVGYRFALPDGRRIAVATDMGFVSDSVRARLAGCDLVLLESNYDPAMLSVSDYPYPLKQRIASGTGHLSNDACAAELAALVRGGGTRFVLGHLSRNTNMPDLALRTALDALAAQGMKENVDFQLQVAPRMQPSEMVIF